MWWIFWGFIILQFWAENEISSPAKETNSWPASNLKLPRTGCWVNNVLPRYMSQVWHRRCPKTISWGHFEDSSCYFKGRTWQHLRGSSWETVIVCCCCCCCSCSCSCSCSCYCYCYCSCSCACSCSCSCCSCSCCPCSCCPCYYYCSSVPWWVWKILLWRCFVNCFVHCFCCVSNTPETSMIFLTNLFGRKRFDLFSQPLEHHIWVSYSFLRAGQPTRLTYPAPRNSQPYSGLGLAYWFPVIRLAIKPFDLTENTLGVIRLRLLHLTSWMQHDVRLAPSFFRAVLNRDELKWAGTYPSYLYRGEIIHLLSTSRTSQYPQGLKTCLILLPSGSLAQWTRAVFLNDSNFHETLGMNRLGPHFDPLIPFLEHRIYFSDCSIMNGICSTKCRSDVCIFCIIHGAYMFFFYLSKWSCYCSRTWPFSMNFGEVIVATGEACAPTMKRALGSARCGSTVASRRMVKHTIIIRGFIDFSSP